MMPLDGLVSTPARTGMGAGLLVLGIASREELRVFVEKCAGRAITEWELDALDAAIRQAERFGDSLLDQAKRDAWDLSQIEVSLRASIVDDFVQWPPRYGPGLGEPGRIASARRCARRRKRNKAAAASRRRNRNAR